VIDRRDQRIGERVRETGQVRVEAGRVDNEEINLALDLRHGLAEQIELEFLVFLDRITARQRQVIMGGVRQLQTTVLDPAATVPNIGREGLLAAVDIDRRHPKSLIKKVYRQVKGGSRLAGPALFVADYDDMRTSGAHGI